MRRVIEDNGRFNWQLAVTGNDVVASFHYPGDKSIYYSTERIANRLRDPSEFGLLPLEVIERYHRKSQTDTPMGVLARKVRAAVHDDASEVPA
ncbi:hypothetical protein [Natronosalvus caseinilyticus]|uniref:hypothetical protein n=1 Tax=Natronosalvus caseinilyticus TaxID=2953747 RepID=UPI0028ADAE3F|nr:hypothetical protein [Natronosalvus caseinilyticus]